MQKTAIIGAGNVGGQTALLLMQAGIRDILLLDVAGGLAKGKALDLEDCASIFKRDCVIEGSDDFSLLKECSVVIITAGLARKPGMTRDDLLRKNSEIVSGIALKVKEYAHTSIVLVVTNPVDIMTSLVAKVTGFDTKRVFGMGVSLDGARFANIIHQELKIPVTAIEAVVIGNHGQTMVPAPALTQVSGKPLATLMNKEAVARLTQATVERGAAIVGYLGSGSACFAPAAAIADIVKAIVNDEKRALGVCAYLQGEYGVKDVYLGVMAYIGKHGIEKIVELKLSPEEKDAFHKSADSVRQQLRSAFREK